MMHWTTFEMIEAGLNPDVGYLGRWHLQFSLDKRVSVVYRLNNREASKDHGLFANSKRLEFQQALQYLS